MAFLEFRQRLINFGFTCIKRGHFHIGFIYLKKRKLLFTLIPSSKSLRSNFYFQIGICLYNLGNFDKAIVYLKRSVVYTTLDKSEHFYYIIRSYCKLEKFNKAEYYLHLLLDRSYQPLFLLLSFYEFMAVNHPLPCSLYNIYSQIDAEPRSIRDKLASAVYYILDGNLHAARELLFNYTATFKRYYYFNLVYMRILHKLGAWDEIITFADGIIEYLSCYDLLLIYASTLYKLEFWNECVTVLSEVVHMNKSSFLAYVNIVKSLINNRSYIPAIARLKHMMFKFKTHSDYLSFLSAVAHHRIGLLHDAERYYNTITTDSPWRKKALFNLALLYFDLDDIAQARTNILRIDPKAPPSPSFDKWKKRILNSTITPVKRALSRLLILFPLLLLLLAGGLTLFFIILLHNK